ncbi:alpha/beta fold hydrolase [Microbaculum marinum]|uniref:Alpha/beta fold hydrolase n=1 Tax=Microbaculum marinum TaxID=1764581 RepID=A0AAW9RNX1_9HYPH
MATNGAAIIDRIDPDKLRWVDVDGVPTRYYEDGSGDPLVLVHGGDIGFADALDTWSLNLAKLSRDFHVFALDKFGQGHTGIPSRDEDYTYDAVLRHFLGWLKAAGVPANAHLVGHSRGGLVVASALLQRPGCGRSAVIIDSATLAPDPADPRLHSMHFYAEVDRRTPNGVNSREDLMVEAELNSHSTAHVTEAYLDRYLEIARLPGQQEALKRMRGGVSKAVFQPSIERARAEVLGRIDDSGMPVRTLVVWGRNDPSAPLAEVGLPLYQRLAARTEDTEMHVFNNAGHYTFREQPAGFNRLVRDWCAA